MKDAFSENVFAKVTQFGPVIAKSLIGKHPDYFLQSKFQIIPEKIQNFVNDRLAYCYPAKRSITMNYKIRNVVIKKFGKDAIGEFISEDVGNYLQKIGAMIHNEYSTKSDEKVDKEFDSVPIQYKLDNDVLKINLFNLVHRLNLPEDCPINQNQIAIRILDVLFCAYSLSYLLNMAEDISQSGTIPPADSSQIIHLSKESFQAKQMIFAAIFRIRSGWDKILFNLIAEIFDIKFAKKDGYFKKIQKMKQFKHSSPEMDNAFNYLLETANSIDNIRHLRDDELHNYGVSVQEIYDKSSLETRLNDALYEAVKLREATALALSLIVGHEQIFYTRTPYLEVDLMTQLSGLKKQVESMSKRMIL